MSEIKSENSIFTLGSLEKDDIKQYLELMRVVFGQASGVDTSPKTDQPSPNNDTQKLLRNQTPRQNRCNS